MNEKKTNTGESYDSFVASTAVLDTFTAPDSLASRPNPGSMQDRPRTPNQIPSSAIEADLPKE